MQALNNQTICIISDFSLACFSFNFSLTLLSIIDNNSTYVFLIEILAQNEIYYGMYCINSVYPQDIYPMKLLDLESKWAVKVLVTVNLLIISLHKFEHCCLSMYVGSTYMQ